MPLLDIRKAAIMGATGPTGRHLARELTARGIAVRVVSRSEERLAQAFAGTSVETMAADALDPEATVRAADGCDLLVDCIGLPMEQIADHVPTARNVAGAMRRAGARGIHISSYWAYVPIQKIPLSESHPRAGGPLPVRLRREAEDILRDAGAAIVNLPDFYGPEVHASTLQQALAEAIAGKTVNWIGATDVPHEYVHVPDAMRAVAALVMHSEADGEHWIVPGAGQITAAGVAEIASRHLGRPVKVRGSGPWMLRLVSLFVRELSALMPMVPTYLEPMAYDGSKLRGLIGAVPTTPYQEAIPRTLDWLAGPTERRP